MILLHYKSKELKQKLGETKYIETSMAHSIDQWSDIWC